MSIGTFFQTIENDFKVVAVHSERLIVDLPKFVKAAVDGQKEAPEILALVQDTIASAMAFVKPAVAVAGAISGNGANIVADAAALAAIEASLPVLKAALMQFVADAKALAVLLKVDWTTLVGDVQGVTF